MSGGSDERCVTGLHGSWWRQAPPRDTGLVRRGPSGFAGEAGSSSRGPPSRDTTRGRRPRARATRAGSRACRWRAGGDRRSSRRARRPRETGLHKSAPRRLLPSASVGRRWAARLADASRVGDGVGPVHADDRLLGIVETRVRPPRGRGRDRSRPGIGVHPLVRGVRPSRSHRPDAVARTLLAIPRPSPSRTSPTGSAHKSMRRYNRVLASTPWRVT